MPVGCVHMWSINITCYSLFRNLNFQSYQESFSKIQMFVKLSIMHCYSLALLFLGMSGRLGDCAASVETAVEGTSQPATTTLSTVFFPSEMSHSSTPEAHSSSNTSGAKCTGPSEETANSILQRRKQPKPEAWDLPQGDGHVKCREGNEKDFPKDWGNAGYNPSKKVAQTLLDKARSEICEAPPRKCVRVSCSNYSAIFLCNDVKIHFLFSPSLGWTDARTELSGDYQALLLRCWRSSTGDF